MNNQLLISGLAGAIFIGMAAQGMAAGDHGYKGPYGPRHSFEELDANSDGQITRDEMDAHRAARFASADTDGDGMLSRDEMLAAAEKRQVERRERMIDHMISRHDNDGDGALTMEEMSHKRGGRMFDHADSDGDGAVSKDEFEAMTDRRGMRNGWMKGNDQ